MQLGSEYRLDSLSFPLPIMLSLPLPHLLSTGATRVGFPVPRLAFALSAAAETEVCDCCITLNSFTTIDSLVEEGRRYTIAYLLSELPFVELVRFPHPNPQ